MVRLLVHRGAGWCGIALVGAAVMHHVVANPDMVRCQVLVLDTVVSLALT